MARETRAFNTQNMNKVSVTRSGYGKTGASGSSVSSEIAVNGSFVIQRGNSNVIIQCPNCQTKFSVSSEAISEIEMPRFHCSRCDNVFDMDPAPAARVSASAATPQVVVGKPTEAISFSSTEEKISPSETLKPEILQETFQAIVSGKEPDARLIPQPKDEPRSLQIPKEINASFESSAPFESLMKYDSEQLKMPFAVEDKKEAHGDLPYGISFGRTPGSASDFTTDPSAQPTPAATHIAGDEQAYNSAASSQKIDETLPSIPRKHPTTAGPMFFAAPIMATLCVLCILCLCLIKSPQLAEAFASNLSSSLPKFAPAGLRVEDVKFNKVLMDSGDTTFIISGKLRNDTEEKYSEITLEGLAFDKKGNLLAASKINPASSLANSNVKSLTPDMLKSAQAAKPNKKYMLEQGSTQDFIIPFVLDRDLNVSLERAAFFSARVYSVRN